jgi:hypothetical protein
LKFDCPHCTQNIEISDEWSVRAVDCPSCRQSLAVPAMSNASISSLIHWRANDAADHERAIARQKAAESQK